MTKKKTKSSKAEEEALARQQHMTIREFLNQEPTRTELLTGLAEKKGEGNELALLEVLLERKQPISGKHMYGISGISKATVSEAAKDINEYLTNKFSKTIEPLKTRRIVICIPRQEGGLHVGYHFACYNTKTKKYLGVPATKKLFKTLWNDLTKVKLWKKLEEDARFSLSEKLKGRDDYQPLSMEIGILKEKLQKNVVNGSMEFEKPKAFDHGRIWKSFHIDSLLESGGIYILSVDVGGGKTTFLRYLQTEFLDKRGLIPIFLDASEIEQWKPEDTRGLAEKLAKKFKLNIHENRVTDFLTQAFRKDIILLVDGLDQIKSGGDEYERLANHILDLAKNNVIIASRPSAVINLEDENKLTFLQLEPFNANAQEKYFGEHYERARELSINAPDLVAIPMLAYMVRMLIEEKRDKHIKTRIELYEEFIYYIFTKYKHGKSRLDPDSRTQIRQSLARISYDAIAESEPYIQKIPLDFCYHKDRLQDNSSGRKGEFLTKSGLVNLIVERSGGGGKDFLFFTHQSFQEYLAAKWAKQNKDKINRIIDEMWNPKWKEVIKFLAGLLSEGFIKRIYSPGCKDNSVHSHLFLAAECCSELERIGSFEKSIFSELKKLFRISYCCEDSIYTLRYLKIPEAMNCYVDILTQKSSLIPASIKCKMSSLAFRMLSSVKYKLQPEHVDKLLQYLIDKGNNDSLSGRRLTDITDVFNSNQIYWLIDIKCKDLADCYVPAGEILYYSKAAEPSHIEHIFKYIGSKDKKLKLWGLRTLENFAICNEVVKERLLYKQYSNNTPQNPEGALRQNNITYISRSQIEALKRYADEAPEEENFSNPIETEICSIFCFLAACNELKTEDVDWLISVLRDGNITSRSVIIHKFHSFFGILTKKQINELLRMATDSTSLAQLKALNAIYKIAERLSSTDLRKLLPLLGSDSDTLKIAVFMILEKNYFFFSSKEVEKLIDLVKTVQTNYSTPLDYDRFKIALNILSRIRKSIKLKQADTIIENIQRIKFDYSFSESICTPFYQMFFDENLCPLPENLKEWQLEKVLNFLNSPITFIQKLGANILVNQKKLPVNIRKMIFELWSQHNPDLADNLAKIICQVGDRLSQSETKIAMSILKEPSQRLKCAAIDCLYRADINTIIDNADKLLCLLKSNDIEIIRRSMSILSMVPKGVLEDHLDPIVKVLDSTVLETKYLTYEKSSVLESMAVILDKCGSSAVHKILNYIEGNEVNQKKTAIEILMRLKNFNFNSIIPNIIACLNDPNSGVRNVAASFLEETQCELNSEQINKIVKAYIHDCTERSLEMAIFKYSNMLSSENLDSIVDLINDADRKGQYRVLDLLKSISEKLENNHIQTIKSLLDAPEDIPRQTFLILKKIHEQRGLLI